MPGKLFLGEKPEFKSLEMLRKCTHIVIINFHCIGELDANALEGIGAKNNESVKSP